MIERDQYKFENQNLKNGLKDPNSTKDAIFKENSYLEADEVTKKISEIKKKNESLKRENEIIRRELANLKNANFKFDKGEDGATEALQNQIELLRKKVITLEEDNNESQRAVQSAKFMKVELEQAKQEIKSLKQFNMNSSVVSGDNTKTQNMVRGYLERIESLQEENDNLRRLAGDNAPVLTRDLNNQIDALKLERDMLKKRVQSLQEEIEKLKNEIDLMK